jgi:hypothetical protein
LWTLIPRTDYVLLQYNGFAVRQPEDYVELIRAGPAMVARASIGALKLGEHLQQIGGKAEVLYNNDGIGVLHVACPQGLAQC